MSDSAPIATSPADKPSRNKKPELQIYRPGAFKHSAGGNTPARSRSNTQTEGETPPKPPASADKREEKSASKAKPPRNEPSETPTTSAGDNGNKPGKPSPFVRDNQRHSHRETTPKFHEKSVNPLRRDSNDSAEATPVSARRSQRNKRNQNKHISESDNQQTPKATETEQKKPHQGDTENKGGFTRGGPRRSKNFGNQNQQEQGDKEDRLGSSTHLHSDNTKSGDKPPVPGNQNNHSQGSGDRGGRGGGKRFSQQRDRRGNQNNNNNRNGGYSDGRHFGHEPDASEQADVSQRYPLTKSFSSTAAAPDNQRSRGNNNNRNIRNNNNTGRGNRNNNNSNRRGGGGNNQYGGGQQQNWNDDDEDARSTTSEIPNGHSSKSRRGSSSYHNISQATNYQPYFPRPRPRRDSTSSNVSNYSTSSSRHRRDHSGGGGNGPPRGGRGGYFERSGYNNRQQGQWQGGYGNRNNNNPEEMYGSRESFKGGFSNDARRNSGQFNRADYGSLRRQGYDYSRSRSREYNSAQPHHYGTLPTRGRARGVYHPSTQPRDHVSNLPPRMQRQYNGQPPHHQQPRHDHNTDQYRIEFDETSSSTKRTATYQLDGDLVFTNSSAPRVLELDQYGKHTADNPSSGETPHQISSTGRRPSSPMTIQTDRDELKPADNQMAPSSMSSLFDDEGVPDFDWGQEVEQFSSVNTTATSDDPSRKSVDQAPDTSTTPVPDRNSAGNRSLRAQHSGATPRGMLHNMGNRNGDQSWGSHTGAGDTTQTPTDSQRSSRGALSTRARCTTNVSGNIFVNVPNDHNNRVPPTMIPTNFTQPPPGYAPHPVHNNNNNDIPSVTNNAGPTPGQYVNHDLYGPPSVAAPTPMIVASSERRYSQQPDADTVYGILNSSTPPQQPQPAAITSTSSRSTSSPAKQPSSRVEPTPSDLAEIQAGVDELKMYLQTHQMAIDEDVLCSRLHSLSELYKRVIPISLKYTYLNNLEQQLWLNTFYLVLEDLRNSEEKLKMYHNVILRIIDQGITFYVTLIEQLCATAGINHEDFLLLESGLAAGSLCSASLKQPGALPNGNSKMTINSCARFMLALGDLNRYKAQLHKTVDYTKARSCYLKAVQLTAGSGRAYNQLAILAMYTQRVIETMYFYMRAMSTKHKFEAAKHTLDALINEFRKRVNKINTAIEAQATEIMRERGSLSDQSYWDSGSTDTSKAFVEVWVGRGSENPSSEEEDSSREALVHRILVNQSTKDLYKHSVLYVLHVCGIAYNKIGMESFDEMAERALLQLDALLRRVDTPLSDVQLMQLITVCMHTIHHTAPQNASSTTAPEHHVQAVRFAMSVWCVLVNTALRHTESMQSIYRLLAGQVDDELLQSNDYRQLQLILPALALMSRWMSMTSVHDMYSGMGVEACNVHGLPLDIWSSYSALWNRLDQNLVADGKEFLIEPSDDCLSDRNQPVTMPEDALTLSFNGVFEASRATVYMNNRYADLPYAGIIYALHHRLSSVYTLGDALVGFRTPYLTMNKSTMAPARRHDAYESTAVPAPIASESSSSRGRTASSTDDQMHALPNLEGMSEEMQKLRLSEHANKLKEHALKQEHEAPPVVWNVDPRYIIPDTNALIDHLPLIVKMATAKKGFNIALPCVVANELRGLAIGCRSAPSPDNDWLKTRAKEAYDAMEALMDSHSTVFAVTTKGTRLNALNFTEQMDEAAGNKAINDDRILQCCVAHIDDTKRPQQNLKDGICLQRHVVLLTQDRALRIKAYNKTVPVRSALQFAKWSGL